MPVIFEPNSAVASALMPVLPPGSQGVTTADRMHAWITQHADEYALLLGPSLPLAAAMEIATGMRTFRPTVSVIIARHEITTDVLTAAMQAGARDVISVDSDESIVAAVERAYQLYLALRGTQAIETDGKVITVWSPKGGVGKTTVAVNLALALADDGARRVCVLDLDLAFGDVAITLQLFPTHTIEHAIGLESSLDAAQLDTLLTPHPGTVSILAAPAHPDVRDRISAALVQRVLAALKQAFDYVVIDTAPAFDEQTLTVMDATDDMVIAATLDVPTLKNVKVSLETLDMLGVAVGRRHLLLNRADEEIGIAPERVESILGLRPAVKITSAVELAAATNSGTPIVLSHPTHPASSAFKDLASLLTGQEIAAPDGTSQAVPEPSNRRLFRKRG